ncbi:MAG: hypothetical protein ACR2L8_07200 [Solirubrobacteraceae bacterium]
MVAGLLVAPSLASARSNVDLLNQANVRLDGAAGSDFAGGSVAAAGDVDGDGRDDVIVGAYATENNVPPRGQSHPHSPGREEQRRLQRAHRPAPTRARALPAEPIGDRPRR